MKTSISWREMFRVWAKVAANSFGGPAGQMAVIHELVVEEKKIVDEKRFLHALNFCMLLPGPEAQQLATYMGWLMKGPLGGLLAGCLFILPGFLSILGLSFLYNFYGDLSWVKGAFYGLKPAMLAIVIGSLYKLSRKSLTGLFYWILALMAFLALFVFNIPFPIVIFASGSIGLIKGLITPAQTDERDSRTSALPKLSQTLGTFLICLCAWLIPLLLVYQIWGLESNFTKIGIFFSQMALVTFGGAYAALSYVAQVAVENYHWLSGPEMLNGLALAETTPGPLIQVVQYVGHLAATHFPEGHTVLTAGLIGAGLSTWMTFAPCFLFIFTLAPYVEYIRKIKVLSQSLSAITASVVGVILNLSIWFCLQTLFTELVPFKMGPIDLDLPVWKSIDLYAFLIMGVGFFTLHYLKKGLYSLLFVSLCLGLIRSSILVF